LSKRRELLSALAEQWVSLVNTVMDRTLIPDIYLRVYRPEDRGRRA